MAGNKELKWLLLLGVVGILAWTFQNGGVPFVGAGNGYLGAAVLYDSNLSIETARTITFGLALLFVGMLYYWGFERGPSKGFIRAGGKFVLNPFQK